MGRVPFMFLGNPGSISLGTWTAFRVKVSLRLRSRVFRNMACRPHGKLIFMHWAFTFDAKTCHGPILGTARNFFVPQGCSSSNDEATRKQWRSNGEAMRKQWRSNGEIFGWLFDPVGEPGGVRMNK